MKKKIPDTTPLDWTKSNTQLAEEQGVNPSTICRLRKKKGILPACPHKRIVVNWREQPWETQNDNTIASALGCSRTCVSAKRREFAKHLARPRHTSFCWAGQDWSQHDDDIAKVRGLTRGAVSSARARHAKGVKPASRKPGKRQAEQMQAQVYIEERKTVHEWLNKLGTPTHEKTGLPMCLLRRLAVQLGVQPWEMETAQAGHACALKHF